MEILILVSLATIIITIVLLSRRIDTIERLLHMNQLELDQSYKALAALAEQVRSGV